MMQHMEFWILPEAPESWSPPWTSTWRRGQPCVCTALWGLHAAPSLRFTPVWGMWTARQGEQGEKMDLAGGQSSSSRYRCSYLHYFHILKNKEPEVANNSRELRVCPAHRLGQSRGWSRQGSTSRAQSISILMESSASSLCVEAGGRKDVSTLPLSLLAKRRWGTQPRAPRPAQPGCSRWGQTDDFSPHLCLWTVDTQSGVSPCSCVTCPLSGLRIVPCETQGAGWRRKLFIWGPDYHKLTLGQGPREPVQKTGRRDRGTYSSSSVVRLGGCLLSLAKHSAS